MPTKTISIINVAESGLIAVDTLSADVAPFSMEKLLGAQSGQIDDDVSASVDDETPLQESASDDLPDFHPDILVPELLQYWEMPQAPLNDLSLKSSQTNPDSEMDSSASEDNDSSEQSSRDQALFTLDGVESAPRFAAGLSLPSSLYAKPEDLSSGQLDASSSSQANSTSAYTIKKDVDPKQSREYLVSLQNNDETSALADLSKNQEPEAQPLPEKKAEQVFSLNELLLSSKDSNHIMLQQAGFRIPQILNSEQSAANNDSTVEELTTNLSQFLSQGMNSQPERSESTFVTRGADASFNKMTFELASLQPEVLAQGAGYKIENYTAQIKVHPQELGPITAQIEVTQGSAHITFLTEHAHVKQLMETNLQELHQAFQSSSLNLTSVNIHQNGSQDKKDQPASTPFLDEEDSDLQANRGANVRENHTINSIIDTYA